MISKSLLPHFLIVGAPKCGTSALHYFLEQHPGTNMAVKEIHFFGEDLNFNVERPSIEEYQKKFKSTGLNGDSSVWYLYSDSIFEELKKLGIQPKIIVMLRNPVDVAYAMHSQNLIDNNEDVLSFEEALSLEEQRMNGKRLPKHGVGKTVLQYRKMGDFHSRLKQIYNSIPKGDVFIGFQNDLKQNPKKFLLQIEEFLGLSNYKNYSFDNVNENKTIANQSLHSFIKHPGRRNKTALRILIPSKKIRSWLASSIYEANIKKEARKKLSDSTRKELSRHFETSIIKLEQLLEKDLSDWKS